MNQKKSCPFCQKPAAAGCDHLALAVEGREFVRRCVQASDAQSGWDALCRQALEGTRSPSGAWMANNNDYTWLETAFCDRFLKHLSWFGGMDYEWRSGPQPGKSGFCVLLWSRHPQRLWWELRDEIGNQCQQPNSRSPRPGFNPLTMVCLSQPVLPGATLSALPPGR